MHALTHSQPFRTITLVADCVRAQVRRAVRVCCLLNRYRLWRSLVPTTPARAFAHAPPSRALVTRELAVGSCWESLHRGSPRVAPFGGRPAFKAPTTRARASRAQDSGATHTRLQCAYFLRWMRSCTYAHVHGVPVRLPSEDRSPLHARAALAATARAATLRVARGSPCQSVLLFPVCTPRRASAVRRSICLSLPSNGLPSIALIAHY